MKFLNIPSNYNFLESIYKHITDNFENNMDRASIMVFLPSRRAVNELKRIFLYNSSKSLILPNIKAIGDIDYDEILLNNYDNIENYLSITKPTSTIKYKLLMIEKLLEENLNLEQAINLSSELEKFFLEVEQQELKLSDLEKIVDEEYSIHWQKILKFLKDFGYKWKNFLKENSIVSTNNHTLANIKIYTDNFKNNKPEYPIIFAGIFTDVKATKELIKTLSVYDNTYYFMKGYLKNTIADDIDSNYYYNNIVEYLSIENIEDIIYENCKIVDDISAINESMCNYSLTYDWNNKNKQINNVYYFECENIYEEIDKITIYINDFINKNGLKNIAIIANQDYVNILELNLKKYNLPVNNTFGNRYIDNDFIKYFLIIIKCYINNFDKESFLNLLKNERISFGFNDDELENYLSEFVNNVLADSISDGNFDFYLKHSSENLKEFFLRIKNYFSIFNNQFTFRELFLKHIELTKNISKGFNDNDLEVISYLIDDLLELFDDKKIISLEDYYELINFILSQQSYSNKYSTYPAINIISQQEARLINYDLVFLFNMNDGVFPKNIATDPWMSKSMRKAFGLQPKEIETGKSAHDFIQLLSQKEVVITRSKKIDGSITFESRFLQRLKTFLRCNNTTLNDNIDISATYNFINTAKYQDNSYKVRPKPNPPISYRPKTMFATTINTLMKNPYDIYAKYILNLKQLNIFTTNSINSIVGTIIHSIFEDYEKELIKDIDKTIYEKLRAFDNEIFLKLYTDKIKLTFKNFLTLRGKPSYNILVENIKFMDLDGIKIGAKIDRINDYKNHVDIVDYKTGGDIAEKSVRNLQEMQLPIEALILSDNGYNVECICYWFLKYNKAESKVIDINEEFLAKTKKYLSIIIEYFKDNPYVATNKNSNSIYDHLSRIDEWLSFI